MQKLEFPANIAVRVSRPPEGEAGVWSCQIALWHERLPFLLTVDTPDPLFLTKLAGLLTEIAEDLTNNPANAEYIGQHPLDDPAEIDPDTLEKRTDALQPVDADNEASSNPVQADGKEVQ